MKKVTIILILSILLSAINGCASPSAENNQSDAETSIEESSSEQVVPESEDSESQMPQQAEEIEDEPSFTITVAGSPNPTKFADDSFWTHEALSSYEDPSVPATISLEYEGSMYSCEYEWSHIRLYDNYIEDIYNDPEARTIFRINRNTQEIISFESTHDQIFSENVDESSARDIAIEFVSQKYDPSLYQVELVRDLVDELRGGEYDSYIFSFYGMIDDIYLSSTLSVEVGIDGNVYGYQDHMNREIEEYIATYGEAKILDDIDRLSAVDINKQIEENIIAPSYIYSSYEVYPAKFTLDGNNNPVLFYWVGLKTKPKPGLESEISETVILIVRDTNPF